jgi:Holliday junction resolvase RusA-like endonuclease
MQAAVSSGAPAESTQGMLSGDSAFHGRVITITVRGTPAPQGSKKYVGQTKDGRGLLVESSKKVKPWRQDVKAAAEELIAHTGMPPIDGPVIVRMVFTLPKPASAPKRRRTYPMRTPDLSKLARSTEDALTEAGIWRDDARVIEYSRLAKVFPGEDAESLPVPGVRITVREVVS